MPQVHITPPEVDEARISIIMDNSFDMLMAGTEVATHQYTFFKIFMSFGSPFAGTCQLT